MRILSLFFVASVLALSFAYASVNYQELSIAQRVVDLKNSIQKDLPQHKTEDQDSALEEEKRIIKDQLTVITGDEDTRYVVVPGDTLKVTYKDRVDFISNIYQVNGQGEIVMPLIGKVKVVGLNRGNARALLNDMLSAYIRDPQLSVDINTTGKFIVMGAAGPGVFTFESGISLMDAVIKAGYDAHRANLANVLVMRGGSDKPQILRLNIKKMMLKGDRSDNIAVKPNDLIYVPNTLFFDADNFTNKIISYITDYYTLGGSTLIKQKTTSTNVSTVVN